VNADSFTSINNFVFSGAQTAGHAVSNLRTGDTLTYTVDSTRANDTLTLSGGVAGQTLGLTLTGGVDISATVLGNAMTFNSGLTTVNLVSANPSNLATSSAVNTITAATTVAAIDNTSAVSFIVTGSAGLTIGAVAALAAPVGFLNAVSVDASALTGVLRIAGSTGADQIKGGSGADIIYGIDGNDELTGNGGADQFRFLANTNGTDTIKDFTIGTDKIGIADAVINVNGAAASADGVQILSTDYEIGRNDISAIVNGDNLKVIELQTALTGAQIAAQVSAGAADAIILVFNSTTGKGEMWYDSTWADAAADGTRVQLATFDNITSLVGVQAFTVSEFMSVAV
jgi:Ca2+-binding RTX toxin-like protein